MDIRPPSTPLPTAVNLSVHEGEPKQGRVMYYQQLVGTINYVAVNTCPDVSRASSKLSEHLQNPSPGHVEAAIHLLKYLISTRFLACPSSRYSCDIVISNLSVDTDSQVIKAKGVHIFDTFVLKGEGQASLGMQPLHVFQSICGLTYIRQRMRSFLFC